MLFGEFDMTANMADLPSHFPTPGLGPTPVRSPSGWQPAHTTMTATKILLESAVAALSLPRTAADAALLEQMAAAAPSAPPSSSVSISTIDELLFDEISNAVDAADAAAADAPADADVVDAAASVGVCVGVGVDGPDVAMVDQDVLVAEPTAVLPMAVAAATAATAATATAMAANLAVGATPGLIAAAALDTSGPTAALVALPPAAAAALDTSGPTAALVAVPVAAAAETAETSMASSNPTAVLAEAKAAKVDFASLMEVFRNETLKALRAGVPNVAATAAPVDLLPLMRHPPSLVLYKLLVEARDELRRELGL